MIQMPALSKAQYRLARHYLNKLRTANTAVRRGQASVSYGFTLFDQDWEQIRYWQAWATRHGHEDEAWAQLTRDFPLAGLEVLSNRSNHADRAMWLDSALQAALQLGDRQAACAILQQLSRTQLGLGALDQGEQSASRLLELAEAANDSLFIGRAHFALGDVAEERGLYADAGQHYRRSLGIFSELGLNVDIGRVLRGLGSISLYVGDNDEGYTYLMRYLELIEADGSRGEVCNALLAVGQALMSLEDYAEAENYIRRSVNMSRTFGYKQLLGAGLILLASWAVEQNQLEFACTAFEEGIEVAREVGRQPNVIHGLSSLGYTRLRLGEYGLALMHLQEGLQMAREAGMPRYICNIQRNLANTYLAVNDFEAARGALHESLTIAQSLGSYSQKVRTLSVVITYSHSLGRNEQGAIWAGNILGDPELDEPLFNPVCARLEMALGSVRYQMALAHGRTLELDDIVVEALEILA